MSNKIIAIEVVSIFIITVSFSCVTAETRPIGDITPPHDVRIGGIDNALYIRGGKIMPFIRPVIIGSINVWVTAIDDESGINHTDLYIDGELKAIFTANGQKSWQWNEKTPMSYRHLITGIAYDNVGNIATVKIIAWHFC